MSGEGDEHPLLVAEFSCEAETRGCISLLWHLHLYPDHSFTVCCAAVWLHDMHNVTLKGINITVEISNVSGVILQNVTGITVQLNTSCSLPLTESISIGIAMFLAITVEVHSSTEYIMLLTTN